MAAQQREYGEQYEATATVQAAWDTADLAYKKALKISRIVFKDNANARASLGLSGKETYNIEGLGDGSSKQVNITARADDGSERAFTARVRIDTPQEIEYYRHGGILHYVLRQLAA